MSTIRFLIFFCCFNIGLSSDLNGESLFLIRLRTEYSRHYSSYERIVNRTLTSGGYIKDSFVAIPTLFLNKSIKKDWDYDNPSNNSQFAKWESFNLKKMPCYDFLVKNRMGNLEYYFTPDLNTRKKRYKPINEDGYYDESYLVFLDYYKRNNPLFVFEIAGINAWFIVRDEGIVAIEQYRNCLIIHDNPLEYIRSVISDPCFLPEFKEFIY